MTERLTANERLALRVIHRRKHLTQSSLTEALDITQQSVSRIATSLSAKGFVIVGDSIPEGKRGKPSPVLYLNSDAHHAIGISIMADSVTTGLINFSGMILGREQSHLHSMQLDAVLDCIAKHIDLLLEKQGLDRSAVRGAGVAMTGYFMGEERTFNPPAPLKHWMHLDVGKTLSQHLGFPVWADNDGNAAAIGEAALGVGRRFKNFAYLYFSSGFGGGVIVDGKPLKGRYGNSGEFAGILPYNIYTHPNLELLRHCLLKRGVKVDSVHDMLARFDPNWAAIDDWIVKVKDSLSLVASAASAVLDTEAVVLGGLMPRSLAEKVIPSIEFYSMPRWGIRRPIPEIMPAEAPGDAVLFGAASMPFEQLFF